MPFSSSSAFTDLECPSFICFISRCIFLVSIASYIGTILIRNFPFSKLYSIHFFLSSLCTTALGDDPNPSLGWITFDGGVSSESIISSLEKPLSCIPRMTGSSFSKTSSSPSSCGAWQWLLLLLLLYHRKEFLLLDP